MNDIKKDIGQLQSFGPTKNSIYTLLNLNKNYNSNINIEEKRSLNNPNNPFIKAEKEKKIISLLIIKNYWTKKENKEKERYYIIFK